MTNPFQQQHLIEEALHKQEVARHKKELSRKITAASIVFTGLQFWFAQLIIWGLSLYHIHSGIWAPWLILEALSSVIVGAVRIGMMGAVRDSRQ